MIEPITLLYLLTCLMIMVVFYISIGIEDEINGR